ncbi:DNA helicase/exodeoxyribonuclease V, gamma subunit [Fodinibius salinus]|uniref:DNA helicase/exodeoxyribonuclease V, gamma subunit n=1 Tax=Fodinibius salinus TaxID=860790 RepID=A0A5D3YQJ6_9BACT|nr:exodeoxyribonuclease V subunit gamma [Fodinibius salinus]TYP95339.1 DNA helicase/exodeoxyribonuclease V, gamma subunit [Fodinibius salinus]
MLNVYHSTKLEDLADQLLEELDDNARENLLEPEIFVVQNHGIGQWLSLHMARRQGISANLKFEFPSERIWSLIRLMDDDIPQTLPSDRGPMTWTLMTLFQDDTFLDEFDNLRHYIRDENPQQQVLRSWKLSEKIADVFDQYLIYRPEMIGQWEKEELKTDWPAERWQMQLWNRLFDHWKKSHDEDKIHRARLQQKLLDQIRSRELDTDPLPERISVFGVSSLPQVSVRILTELSDLIPVDFYQLNIDPGVKDCDNFRNPLLQSLGKQGTTFMSLFPARAEIEYRSVENTDHTDNSSVFNEVQSDLVRDKRPSDSEPDGPPMDTSIRVHSCHSPMREVEVLYDQLLAVLDENPGLNPDDILIMTPDIETYAPMIEAVFEAPDEGQPGIPYSIADRGIQGDRPATQSLLKILELCGSRFKITDVFDLLDAVPVREVFGFSDDDLNRLEKWVEDNRIRWGIDGNFKQQMNLPESDHFTWKSGLQRMLLGYTMNSDEEHLFDDIFPYEEIETSDDAALAGRFSRFMQALFQINDLVGKEKSISRWKEELTKIPDRFLPDNRDYYWEISKIREALNTLTEQADLAAFDGRVPFQVVRLWLQEQLQEQTTGGGRLGRGVTFSSLKPMRSIPFEMIGIIGMNEDAFPRSNIPIEFDLMHLDPQPGDPVQAEEDRYLFLENLISARSILYFSYVGQSNRQDADFPPSVILAEFLDYLEDSYGLSSGDMVTEHRLQAFSPRYFMDGQLFSYSQSQQKIGQRLVGNRGESKSFIDGELPEPDDDWKKLSIGNLISFFQHPAKFLLRNRLGIYLDEEEVLTEDRELFALERLDKYRVEQALLEQFLKEQPLESYEKVMQSRDWLPEGWSGKQVYQQKASEAREFGNAIQQQLNRQQLPDCEVDIQVNGFRITGVLGDVFPQLKLQYRFGKARPKDKVDFWIRHLLFQRVKPDGHSGKSLMLNWEDTALQQQTLAPVEDPNAILSDLLDWFWQGMQCPLDFYCKSSYAYAESILQDEKDEEAAVSRAQKKWESGYNYTGEKEDPSNKLVTDGREPLEDSDFRAISCGFWEPYFEALKRGES